MVERQAEKSRPGDSDMNEFNLRVVGHLPVPRSMDAKTEALLERIERELAENKDKQIEKNNADN